MPDPARSDEDLPHSNVLDRVTDGVVAVDTEFRYTYVNQQAEDLLGAARSEMLGRCLWDVFPFLRGSHAQDKLKEAMASQEMQSYERRNPEVDRWFNVRAYPDEDGLSIYFTDITERKRQRTELERKNRRLQVLFDEAPDAVVIHDVDGTVLDVNEQMVQDLGYSHEELLSMQVTDFEVGKEPEELREIWTGMEVGDRDKGEGRHRRKDGSTFPVTVWVNKVEIDGAIRFVALSRDVTEREAHRQERERSNTVLKTLLETMPIGVLAEDADRKIVAANASVCKVLGLADSCDDLLGRDCVQAAAQLKDRFADPEAFMHRIESLVDRQRPVLEEEVRMADGRILLRSYVPYERPEGTGHLWLYRDVTERKRREDTLEQLTGEYEALLGNAEDAIFLLDVEGEESAGLEFRYERLNPYHESTTGLTTDAVRGKTPSEVLGPEAGAEVEKHYRRCVEKRAPVEYEEELSMPEGRIVWQMQLAPVIVDDRVVRIVGIARDVTDRVQQERELRRKNERLDEFAGVVSHDLRNPLNIALGRTTLAQEELARDDIESVHLDKVEQALDRMESIIMDTLILARRGETVAETVSIPIADLVERCWDMVDAEGTTLDLEDTFTLRGDRERLRHIFENLFRNAVQHGDPNATIWVGRADDETLYVEDDGPGIPVEKQDAVFETGHTSSSEGTGFGLTIVKRIAEAHGWEVRLTNGRQGGARFEFSGVDISEAE